MGADSADMQSISKSNKEFWFLLFVIDIYSKYAWLLLLKDKKVFTITYTYRKALKQKANQARYG